MSTAEGVPSSSASSSFYFSPELMDLCCVSSHGIPTKSGGETTALMRAGGWVSGRFDTLTFPLPMPVTLHCANKVQIKNKLAK